MTSATRARLVLLLFSKSRTGKHHAYYLCQNKRCKHAGKSIRRDVIEGECKALQKTLTPTQTLFGIATSMFKALWNARKPLSVHGGKHFRKRAKQLNAR